MNQVKILQIVNDMDGGGVENIIKTYYQHKKSKFHFDFISHTLKKGILEDFFLERGSKIFKLNKRNILDYINKLSQLISNEYDFIHIHQNHKSWFPALIVKLKFSRSKVIIHNHTNLINPITNYFEKVLCNFLSDLNVACSIEAGEALFYKKYKVLYNSINYSNFLYNKKIRDELRRKYEIKNTDIVLGCVARFEEQKNYGFLVDFSKEIIKINKNFKFFFIGDGSLKKEIINKVNEKSINQSFIFKEPINNVYDYYNVFDLFILPSLYEGLGIVAIEAQINGLHCFLSNKFPKEVKVNDNVNFLKLNKEIWINELAKKSLCHQRKSIDKKVFDKKFSLENFIKSFDNLYA